ncbi:hypothetical protein [Dyadobacter sediminis]|uniref:Baseplate protein J-like domain-containing protein n=1 Tax=Dyadobacter sediminis TaxID=1493691 RepID=A0A5R9KJQ5_9BACT|nr:hypothetical protein [Dyadobacter sediminis]TLU96450.1 hypothetical protein FEM55_04770 [Dyadobacter sediminis]GGB82318.1 hypothetical protein GCM10011325_07310 [Dyadobacter sediminis]
MSQGTNQKDRIADARALMPDYFRRDARTMSEIYAETRRLAEAVIFYPDEAGSTRDNWSAFFKELDEKVLSENYREGDVSPHLALFLTFLNLYKYLQNDLNALVSAHLDFFYRHVLGLKDILPQADRIYIFPELARNVQQFAIPADSRITAGKDEVGNNILFTTEKETVISLVKLTGFKSVYNPKETGQNIRSFPESNVDPGEDKQGWHPFGAENDGENTTIGWALSSPVLLLKEGTRTVSITFSQLSTDSDINPGYGMLTADLFEMQFTTAGKWFSSKLNDAPVFNGGNYSFVTVLDETAPAVSGFDPAVHGYAINAKEWPVVRVRLRKTDASVYQFLRSVRFGRIDMHVSCENAASVLLSNDYGVLDAGKASQAFGFSPVVGSSLYIGLEEIFYKPLLSLKVNMAWKGIPEEGFPIYYEGYTGDTNSLVKSNNDFKVSASVRSCKEWKSIAASENEVSFPVFQQPMEFNVARYFENKQSSLAGWENEDGLLCLSISSPDKAFGHALFPRVLTRASIQQAQGKDVQIPNEPYTPVMESVRLSYTAAECLHIGDQKAGMQFYHIEPFGIRSVLPGMFTDGNFPALLTDSVQNSGYLYIGLKGIEPPLQISLFFAIMEESTAAKGTVTFSFAELDSWKDFLPNQILSDTTTGLQQTGILTLQLPETISMHNPAMPAGQYWLRISVQENAANFDRITEIRPNAIRAKREMESVPVTYNLNKLPPGSVQSFLPAIREIRKTEQPYPSFSGRPDETNQARFVRISEMLRHKNKAVTAWDFEHLVLENFPEIYKVKCIRHSSSGSDRVQPGHVHIIVIPRIMHAERRRLFRPVAGQNLLNSIDRFVDSVKSPQVQAEVTNAAFVEIKIVAQISFRHRMEAGFYINKLQKELEDFLSPWAFREDMEVQLGSKLHLSSVISFIETREYINFIDRISWEKNGETVRDQEIILDQKSVVVSSGKHELKSVIAETVPYQNYRGIGQMLIDINFEVQ